MKKLIGILTILLFMTLPTATTHAKSYTIDEVQIKAWIHPNGDMLVNEIFTYTFDGDFTQLSRSFPNRHNGQIEAFEAYLLNEKHPVVSEITQDMLIPATVTTDGVTRRTKINAKDQTISVFYMYNMRGAVKSYDTYSELDLTWFEEGSNHDSDLNNVSISFVILGAAAKQIEIHGFMYDQLGDIHTMYWDGIKFATPVSKARTITATRVLFPSYVMMEQAKVVSPMTFKEAVAAETERLKDFHSKLEFTPIVKTIVNSAAILFILIAGIILFTRQRPFAPFGNVETVLQTDPLYLFFVDHNGAYHPKSFLAGLFSLAEKGHVDIQLQPSAERFKNQKKAPEETLAFQYNYSKEPLLPYEQTLINSLFKVGLTNRKFHLHDIAGGAKGDNSRKKSFLKTQKDFEKMHYTWHNEVEKLMVEAGSFSTVLPKILKWSVLAIITVLMVLSSYVENQNGWGIALVCVCALFGFFAFRGQGRTWTPILFFVFVYIISRDFMDNGLQNATLFLLIGGAVLVGSLHNSLLVSFGALYTKMSICKFRRQIRLGPPADLSNEELEKWLGRAYLLNKSKTGLPKFQNALPTILPLAALFQLNEDPLEFIHATWGDSYLSRISSRSSTYSSGGYDSGGGGGGGGGDGGGGAGAD